MSFGKAGNLGRTARAELGKRDRLILASVIRYRLTTNTFVHQRFLSHAQENAVVKVTGRLVKQNWLTAYPLLERRQYFVAGPRLVKLHGLPLSRTRPLGPQSLSTHFAVAHYCQVQNAHAQLCEGNDLRVVYPWLAAAGLSGHYLTEPHAMGSLLRCVRVDLGGTPEHIVKKCIQDLSGLQRFQAFNQLVTEKGVIFVVLTASSTKRALVENALTKRSWPRGLRFNVGIVPELGECIAFV